MRRRKSRRAATMLPGTVLALAMSTGSHAQNQSESLDDWMNRTTGNNYDKSDRVAEPKAAPRRAAPSTASSATATTTEWGDMGVYLRLNAGVNLAMDPEFKDQRISYQSGLNQINEGFSGVKLKTDAGLDLNLGVGFALSDNWEIEFVTGMAINTIKGASGSYFFNNLTTGRTQVDTIQSASGYLWQLPAMVNLRYKFDLGERVNFGIFAGVGGQFSRVELDSATVSEVVNGGPPTITTLPFDIDSNGWSFRYQLGFDLSWQIHPRAWVSVYTRYSATSKSDLRDIGDLNVSIDSFQNASIGGRVTLAF